jgi:hypothetical protein
MTDIAELFARDPMALTKDNVTEIIQHYQKCRGQFNLGNMTAGSSKPKSTKTKQAEDLADSLQVKLDLEF